MQSLGVLCATIYVFLAFSRFTEFLVQKIGVNLYIMAIMMFFSLIIVALNGRMTAFLNQHDSPVVPGVLRAPLSPRIR